MYRLSVLQISLIAYVGLANALNCLADDLTMPHPDRADRIEMQGNHYLVNDQFAQALPLIKKAISINPHREGYWNDLGVCYSQMGNKTRAISAYEIAVNLKPTDFLVLNNLAINLNEIGHHAEAVKYAKLEIKANPDDQDNTAMMNKIIHP